MSSNSRFSHVRQTTSPTSHQSSFTNSVVTSRSNRNEGNLDYGSSTNIKSSQVSYNNNFHQSQVSRSGIYGGQSQVSESSVRHFYKGLGSLPENRLVNIAQNFMKIYGSGGQIKKHDAGKIQVIAHSQATTKFQQTNDDVKQLIEVLDSNKDGRVSEDDVLRLCRKYLNCEKKPIAYTPMVEDRLSVARRLFKQFDVQKKGFLTEKQVPNLLSQTYRTLGRDFKATQEDIRSWMKLADGDGDGHVTLIEYQKSIIRALKKQGIKIYED